MDEHEIALREDYAPWSFGELASPATRADQAAYQDELRSRGHTIGRDCVVSRLAAVHPDTLTLGDRSTVAAHAHLSGDLVIGADCTVNVSTVVRGTVRLGDAVRIGGQTSLLGFDHGMADLTEPIFRQPMSSLGITVGDDVWIGSHVVVLDGVRIGSHAVVGAGSVVTRDVPEWAVVVGNPARIVRDRRTVATTPDTLRSFADRARADAPDLLARHWDGAAWTDSPGGAPTVRAHCDAIEIADLLLGTPPEPWSRDEHLARLHGRQSADGLVHELGWTGGTPDVPLPGLGDDTDVYHLLSVGYALDLLGSTWRAPITPVAELDPAGVVRALEDLDFPHDAWSAGHRADALGTALTWELRAGRPVPDGVVDALLGWLLVHRDPGTGLWGVARDVDGLRLPVNGFYRTVRGTFAQLGVDLPGTEATIDAVLRHAADPRTFGPGRETACDALDVLHPLSWLTRHDRRHRWPEIQQVAQAHAQRIVGRWVPGHGFAFDTRPGSAPTLQGTEMWLATLWYAADLLDESEALGYRPRGVHRPEAALTLG
ncbi:DapH/DapD/GlmU-related protein [Cellulomonas sp. Root485]|uniref:acyltransferase n=1 Tax=Cellulomonas sp. Root485 TaxID=1736546 RepID=UPI001F2CD1E1|nr:acyltransferase [Cellulomonas sp. Root485]